MTNITMFGTSGHPMTRGAALWHVGATKRPYGNDVAALKGGVMKPRAFRAFTQLIQTDRCRSVRERVLDPMI
ncbi:hypothetical protein [Saccharopolyspora taberi]|uniref:Uncharacterized protein n=1 Tax=Saccharopolyspora taberi TaxID=60895 RepID=A0ABN3VJE8_9PSEU